MNNNLTIPEVDILDPKSQTLDVPETWALEGGSHQPGNTVYMRKDFLHFILSEYNWQILGLFRTNKSTKIAEVMLLENNNSV